MKSMAESGGTSSSADGEGTTRSTEFAGQLQARQTLTKYLSLLSQITKWAGNDKAVSLHEYFEAIESSARVGNWSEQDLIQVATLKLAESARAFYNRSLELHEPIVTGANFKTAFKRRFRVVRTDHYHFTPLQMARK
jgi:hypothetical protein